MSRTHGVSDFFAVFFILKVLIQNRMDKINRCMIVQKTKNLLA